MSILEQIKLLESSWSRIIQHIENDNSFAVISAFLNDFTEQENFKRHEELRSKIRNLGLGYIEQSSGYTYQNQITGQSLQNKELSFFIPKITYEDAIRIAKKFDQESILFKDINGFNLVYTKDFVDKEGVQHKTNDVAMSFKMNKDKEGKITFNPDTLKYAYSSLIKANHNQTKQYTFVTTESIEEAIIPSRTEAMLKKNIITWRNIL